MASASDDVVIVHDAAIGADGHVDTGLFEVLVTSLGDFDGRGSLATADALGLAGDAEWNRRRYRP